MKVSRYHIGKNEILQNFRNLHVQSNNEQSFETIEIQHEKEHHATDKRKNQLEQIDVNIWSLTKSVLFTLVNNLVQRTKNKLHSFKNVFLQSKLILTFSLFLTAFLFTGIHAQTSVTLEAAADADVYTPDPTFNYGNCFEAWVSFNCRILTKFDLSSIPSGATILSANLKVYQYASASTNDNIEVRRVTNDWIENTGSCSGVANQAASWQQRMPGINWTTAGGDMSSTVYANAQVGTAIKYYSWNISTLVQEWVNGTPNYGLALKNSTESGSGTHKFHTRQATSNKPVLEIVYTMEPIGGPVLHTSDQKTASGTGNSVSIPRPDNVSQGDMVLLVFSHQRSPATSASSFTTPPGFTLIRSEHDASASNRVEVVAFYKIATNNEPATYTSTVTTYTNTPRWKAYSVRVTGFDPYVPIGTHSGSNSGANSVFEGEIPAITTTKNKSLIISAATARLNISGSSIPSEMFLASAQNGTGTTDGSDNAPSLQVNYQTLPNAGSTNAKLFSWVGLARAAGLMFSINAAEDSYCENSKLINAGFESNLNRWNTWGTISMSNDAFAGGGAAQIAGVNSGITQEFLGTPGKTYNVTVWTKAQNIQWGQAYIEFFNSNWQLISSTPLVNISNSTTYNPIQVTGVAPANTFYVQFAFGGSVNSGGHIRIDNICMEESDIAESPGGVAGTAMWLKANKGVSTGSTLTWQDQSGFGRSGVQSNSNAAPALTPNTFNFNPALTFDGSNDCIPVQNLSGLPTGASQVQMFAVANHTNITRGWNHIFSYGSGNNNQIFGLGKHTGTANATTMLWGFDAVSSATEFSGNKVALLDGKYTGTQGIISTYGSQKATITASSSRTTSAGYVGVDPVLNSGTYWQGNISEILVYPGNLNTSQINRINTYLSLKYGITLDQTSAQNYTASDGTTVYWNGTTNSSHKNNIAGIVRDDVSALVQKQSRSVNTGLQIVVGNGNQIANTNALNNSAFSADKSALVWGDNNGSVSAWTTTGAPSGFSIIARSWKVQKTGSVGSVRLQVASSGGSNGLPSVTGSVTLLLDGDGNFTSGATAYTMTLNGTNWEVDVDLQNGQFFTFATCTTIGLPVFASGSSSTRCQGAGQNTYSATSTNSTGISFSLDAASLAGGNSINSATGQVTYVNTWSGTSTITATAQGCGGPRTSTHTVTITPNVTTPVFSTGSTSTRCQGAGNVIYTATSNNTSGITYSLDASSLAGGNTINAGNGTVTYHANWSGTSVITASAAGCSGPLTATHTVTINPSIGIPVFVSGTTSVRCQGAGTVTYTTNANNTTNITYSLDATSVAAGNNINSSTGAVTYLAGWVGQSVITATATGCNGPTSATHTVTITPNVGIPVFSAGSLVNRCGGAGSDQYTATANHSTQITYSLDASSLAGGNTINASTGMVNWNATWVGVSTITATAFGCNGPTTGTLSVASAGVFAIDDNASGTQGKPLYIQLTANDLCNFNVNSITIVSPPQSGNVQMGQNGEVIYLPAGNFSGNDAFVYQICQTANPGICSQATVFVYIEETFIDPCAEATRNKTYYLPFEENSTLRNALLSAGSVNYHSNTVRSLVSIKIPYPGIQITYDHWEDGYETNIQNPVQSTTQVWGDGNLMNGVAPGYPNDILPPGAYIVLDNQFQYNPRVSSTIAFDGKDKIFTTGDVSISKVTGDAGFGGGSIIFDVQNLKTNVYDVTRYGEYFVIPFGENVTLGNTVAFRYTGISIKAAQNGTVFSFDYNGDGIVDFTQTLNEGQFWYYTGTASQPGSFPADVNNANDIKAGAVVTANKPVGVDLIFGDGFNFGTRNMALLPSIFNANEYYTPVYTTTPTNADLTLNTPVHVYFTNVLDNPITVQWSSKFANGTVTIPANGTNFFEIPYTANATGYKFQSTGGEPFSAISIVDADANGSRYDWAFNLIPEERLTSFSSIAWAPGSRDGAGNYNPIWVTPVGNTTLYIKLDGNLTGTTSTMSPCGIPYDLAVPVDLLSSYQIFDNVDNDQSGTAIYTCDGTKFVAVWGQNSHANGVASPPGSPAQDVGYVLEPKCLEALIFANDDSRFTEPNTPITIDVKENDFAFLSTINPSSVSTFGLLQPSNGSHVANANGTITYTPNPGFQGVDYFEYRICAIEYPALCDIALVTVRVSDCPTLESQNLISGKVFIEQLPDNGQFNNEDPAWGIRVDLYLDTNCNGVIDASENVVQSTQSDPSGNYSFAVANGFNAADNFEPVPSFTNNTGGITWSSAWIEQNDDLNFNSGNVRILADVSTGGSGNAIRLSGNGTSTLRGISRSLTFNGATAATLRFKYRRQGLNNQGEQLQVLINGTQVLVFEDGDYVGTDANYFEVTYNLASFNANGSNVVLFRVNNVTNADDFYWIDDVELIYFKNPTCYITKVNTISNNNYTPSLLNQQTAMFTGLNSCVKDKNLGVKALLVATDDIAYTSTDVAVNINVLINDVIGKPNPASVTTAGVINQPANGSVVVLQDGSIVYTPNPGFNGTDDFEYRVCSIDDPSVCDIALVTIQVSCTYVPQKNSIIGKIFSDNNLNGNLNAGETGMPGLILNLVRDMNGNGLVDVNDPILQSTTTNDLGDYQFIITPPTTAQTFRDNFNTNGSGSGSNGTTSWASSPWQEINESNGFGTPSIQVTGNQLRIQGEDLHYLDQFNANTTANQSNGTVNWSGQSWVEIGESNGFSTTQITITSTNGLRISGSGTTTVLGARRTASLSGAGLAHLSFTARASGLDDQFDFVDVQVATNSGGPWTTLTRIEGPAQSATYYFDLVIPEEFYTSTSTIRFVSSGVGTMTTSDIVFFDDIKISYLPATLFKGVSRAANIASALEANLSMSFAETDLDFDVRDYVDLEISQTASGPWTLLRRFTGADGNQSGNVTFDISPFISTSTTIRFVTSPSVNFNSSNAVLFDNVQIEYQVPTPASYIVQLAQPLPQDITLTSPLPNLLHAVAFTGAGQGSCNNSFGIARADLSVTKSAQTDSVYAGNPLTYTISVTNNGPARSTNTMVQEFLPSGFTVTQAVPNQGSWSSPNWNIGTLEPGQTRTLQLTGMVSRSLCDDITNQVVVSGSIADPVTSNNSAQITTIILDSIPPTIIACATNRVIQGCSVSDIEAPAFSEEEIPVPFTMFASPENQGAITDNCQNEITSYQDSLSGTCPIMVTRKWFFKDVNGNISTCTQTISITDTVAPQVINLPEDLVLEGCSLDALPAAINNFADFETLGGEILDNCTGLTQLTFSSSDQVSGSCPIHVTRTYTIKDACQNSVQVIHNLFIDDTLAPEIQKADSTILLGCNPVVLPGISMVENHISIQDNCSSVSVVIVPGQISGDCIKEQSFYIQATDVCGNISMDSLTFTWVIDNQPPSIVIPSSILDLGVNPGWFPNQDTVLSHIIVHDLCGMADVVISDSLVTGTCNKQLQFAISATDLCGNVKTDTITYFWIDTTALPLVSHPGEICLGDTIQLTPSDNGVWSSNNPAVTSVTSTGLTIGLSPGNSILTYTRSSDGCSSGSRVTILQRPLSPVADSILQPTCTVPFGSIFLTNLPEEGTWSITRNPGDTLYSGFGSSVWIHELPKNTTYTFTVSNEKSCASYSSAEMFIQDLPENPVLSGPDKTCLGISTSVFPADGGIWTSSDTTIVQISQNGLINTLGTGQVMLTYTRNQDGCVTSKPFIVHANPIAPVIGTTTQPTCTTPTGSVVLSGLPATGNWTITRYPDEINYSGTGNTYIMTGLPPNDTYTFVVTNDQSCISDSSALLMINPIPSNPVLSGATTLCVGSTTQVTPSTAGVWSSSNTDVATINNTGLVSGISAGDVILTYTRTIDGCSSTLPLVVLSNPTAPVAGTITQPTCTDPSGSVILNGLPSSGNWTLTRLPGNITYSGSGTNYTVINLPPNQTYTFTVTTEHGCSSPQSNSVIINNIPSTPTLGGPDFVCVGNTVTVTPTTQGTWTSSNPSIASVTSAGIVTGNTPGMVVLTYTRNSNGCSSTKEMTVSGIPDAPVVGQITQPNCAQTSGSVVLSGLPSTGTWTLTRIPGNVTYTGSGTTYTVTGLGANATYTFTVKNMYDCTSAASADINILPMPAPPIISVDYMGTVCLTQNKEISVSVTNGTGPFNFSWSGPSGFTGTTQTIQVSQNGNYYITVTDANLCTATTQGFVYEAYNPFIVSLNTDVCEGQSVNLSINSATAVSFIWSANAFNATTSSVTVVPSLPSSTYQVTITNDAGCTASPTVIINVIPKPVVSITGPNAICVGQTSSLSPSTNGTWISNNPSVATVSNTGIVTGVGPGTATFVYTNSQTNCASDNTTPITVFPKPVVDLAGPASICIGATTQLVPNNGGQWFSTNTEVATVTNDGVVTGVNTGNVQFYFTDSTHFCSSDLTTTISVDFINEAVLTGNEKVCIGSHIVLSSNIPGGTWSSSNPSVANINNSGIVTGNIPGTITIYYDYASGACSGQVSKTITVHNTPEITLTGATEICAGNATTFLPDTGGIWTSSNPAIASISNSGIVTGLQAGYVTFTFQDTASGCPSAPSIPITIHAKPEITLTGASALCVGQSTTILSSITGTWTNTNPNVASITQDGLVNAMQAGSTTFTFTDPQTGCAAEESIIIQVGNLPNATLDFHGSVCISDTSKISVIPGGGTPDFTYNWVGPLGFQSNTSTISVTDNGMYYVTVTDAFGCKANASGFMYQRFDPFVVNLNSTICEGQSVQLSVNAPLATAYLWSSNAGEATTSGVTVTPPYPSAKYYVTVTNNLGCSAVAYAEILVHPKPNAQISGPNQLCVGQSSQMVPGTGGTWASTNPAVAGINNFGQVTAFAPGSARFIFTQTSTGCKSDTTASILVTATLPVSYVGPSAVCLGGTTQVLPSSGGNWTSSNPAVATVTASGLVTSVSSGMTQLTFTSSEGCVTGNMLSVTVHDKPAILLDGPNQICLGSTTQMLPSTGGTWTSTNPVVATINSSGLVTGISPGNVRFMYTNQFTGCTSDSSVVVTIISGSTASISGPQTICVGSTTNLSPITGGTWSSNNPGVASVTNGGIVTGLSQGTATFTFTSFATGCPSMATNPVMVNPRPSAIITGPSNICVGTTSSLAPNTGGFWTSSNPTVASVSPEGIITGISTGLANFTYTYTETGCTSLASANVFVNPKPNSSINSGQICVGGTTTVSPSSGGSWSSSNPAVATVNNSGLVTGISQGTTQFIYTESSTGCISNPTNVLTVLPRPVVSITGPSEICQGTVTQLSPSTGGTWVSSNATIATVTNGGLVTGISNGQVHFTFTSNQGCISEPTGQIIVHGKPVINITGPGSLCIGSTSQLIPSSGGTWTSSRPSVASITNTGLVTAHSLGTARFVFTNSATGCVSDSSAVLAVNNGPSLSLIGPSNICIGQTTQLSPTVGGTWMSLTPSVASISNAGLVTGLGAGQASFRYVQSATGCEATINNVITVQARPVISLTGSSPICVGSTTSFSPNSGGTWMSLQSSVASINNSGIVTGLSQGSATFVFTSAATGCTSLPSSSVSVIAKPTTILNGPPQICIGGNTQFLPATGGTWSSNHPAIASIDESGMVTGLVQGIATFNFTETATGCISNPTSAITVSAPATLSVSGPSNICLGYNTTLSASTAGIWMSTNPAIAKTTSTGTVTGLAPGKVSFYFMENGTGCISYLPDDIITVTQCIDPDFNVTAVNVPVNGNVNTNDEVPAGTTYLNSTYLVSKPNESTANLVMNASGQYTFTADTKGEYVYNVMVCLPGMQSNCPVSTLIITVVNPNTELKNMVTNLDITYTYVNQSATLNTTENDKCISALGCEVNPALLSVIQNPKHGSAIALANGNIIYTPSNSFVGMDTLMYQVCTDELPVRCFTSYQIITVMAGNALNSLVASDDFFTLSKGGSLQDGLLLANDYDPERNPFIIMPIGSSNSPVSFSAGQYYITQSGSLFFTPEPNFTGPADIVYTICDNQNFCVNATAHILVLDNLKLRIRAYLEGPMMENGNAKGTDNRPLMRDNLRVNPYTGTNYIPDKDPYSYPMDMIDLTSVFSHVGPGNQSQYRNIPNPSAVFAVTGQNAIVDWVFIELRSREDNTLVLATRSALIQRDGDVVELDGISPVEFPGLRVDSCYVVLRHRNHFGVMSLLVSTSDLVDFTLPTTPVFDFGTSKNDGYDYTGLGLKAEVVQDYMVMWAGDFDSNGKIKFVNPNDDQNYLFFEVLSYPGNVEFMANYNFAYGYLQGDFDLNGKAKYDNPDDDKNMLFYQVLFHPLNVNFISNFNFIIEQVPARRIN